MTGLPPIKDAILALQEEAGDNQSQFAARVGGKCDRVRVNTWVNGHQRPALPYLQRLVAMGLDPRYLMGCATSVMYATTGAQLGVLAAGPVAHEARADEDAA